MHEKTATEIHNLFLSGELSAEEIAKHTLKRIDAHNEKLVAFLSIFEKRLLEKAKALDEKRKKKEPLGKLAGVPIALKDNIHVAGEMTTCASKILENYRAPFDATVSQLIEQEDGLLIGKTNMDEFAMGGSGTHSFFGPTRNPWHLDYIPGGSSSGSTAAVAARLCPIALGSDTGGSIRQPAALSGITGFKPTYGRVSRFGLVAFGSSLDQIGPLTQNAEDAALIMEVIGKHCERDSTSIDTPLENYLAELKKPIGTPKIGVPWNFLKDLTGEQKHNFDESLNTLKDMGCEIVDIDLSTMKYGIAIYYILATAEASTNLARFDGIRYGHRSKAAKTLDEIYDLSRQEGFGWEVKNRILLGTHILSASAHEAYYTKAQRVRTLVIRQINKAFAECDFIVHPTSPTPATKIGAIKSPLDEYLGDLYTVSANLAGLPAIATPSGFTSNNLPLGIQFMGPQRHDAAVLHIAHAFQKATSHIACPPLFGGNV